MYDDTWLPSFDPYNFQSMSNNFIRSKVAPDIGNYLDDFLQNSPWELITDMLSYLYYFICNIYFPSDGNFKYMIFEDSNFNEVIKQTPIFHNDPWC